MSMKCEESPGVSTPPTNGSSGSSSTADTKASIKQELKQERPEESESPGATLKIVNPFDEPIPPRKRPPGNPVNGTNYNPVYHPHHQTGPQFIPPYGPAPSGYHYNPHLQYQAPPQYYGQPMGPTAAMMQQQTGGGDGRYYYGPGPPQQQQQQHMGPPIVHHPPHPMHHHSNMILPPGAMGNNPHSPMMTGGGGGTPSHHPMQMSMVGGAGGLSLSPAGGRLTPGANLAPSASMSLGQNGSSPMTTAMTMAAMVAAGNNNAPPVHYCGACNIEIKEDEKGIQCTAISQGCNKFFHQHCSQLIPEAFDVLIKEPRAEWVCESCVTTKNIIFCS